MTYTLDSKCLHNTRVIYGIIVASVIKDYYEIVLGMKKRTQQS